MRITVWNMSDNYAHNTTHNTTQHSSYKAGTSWCTTFECVCVCV